MLRYKEVYPNREYQAFYDKHPRPPEGWFPPDRAPNETEEQHRRAIEEGQRRHDRLRAAYEAEERAFHDRLQALHQEWEFYRTAFFCVPWGWVSVRCGPL
jgi:hypothetical protein